MRDKKIIRIISLVLIILFLSAQLGLADIGYNSRSDRVGIMPTTFSFDEDEKYQSEEENEGLKVEITTPVEYSESEKQELATIIKNFAEAIWALLDDPTDPAAMAAYHHWLDELIRLFDKKLRKMFAKLQTKQKESMQIEKGGGKEIQDR